MLFFCVCLKTLKKTLPRKYLVVFCLKLPANQSVVDLSAPLGLKQKPLAKKKKKFVLTNLYCYVIPVEDDGEYLSLG